MRSRAASDVRRARHPRSDYGANADDPNKTYLQGADNAKSRKHWQGLRDLPSRSHTGQHSKIYEGLLIQMQRRSVVSS